MINSAASRTLIIFLAITIALITPGMSRAERTKFILKPGEPNRVMFISKAPLETIEGITDQISGVMTVDPQDLHKNPSAQFEVQMADLDTDNGIRNGHMRDNHLHTDKFPTSSFTLKEIKGLPAGKLPDGQQVSFMAVGDFTLHGVTRTIEPQITAKWDSANNSIDVTAKFTVLLQDYDIPRPKFLFMKLSKEQRVEIDFTAVAE